MAQYILYCIIATKEGAAPSRQGRHHGRRGSGGGGVFTVPNSEFLGPVLCGVCYCVVGDGGGGLVWWTINYIIYALYTVTCVHGSKQLQMGGVRTCRLLDCGCVKDQLGGGGVQRLWCLLLYQQTKSQQLRFLLRSR